MLVLFDSNGKYVNSVGIADSYGQAGGWTKSRFTSDSTLLQHFKYDYYGIDSLGNDIYESTYRHGTVVIHTSGEITVEDIKNHGENDYQ